MEQKHHADFNPVAHILTYYSALRARGITVDVVDPSVSPLDGYRLVVAPGLHLLAVEAVRGLEKFVTEGGHLLLGARSGFKDEHNAMLPSRQPGDLLGGMLGARVEDYFAITGDVPVEGVIGSGLCRIWAEPLKADRDDVEVLLSFGPGNAWLAGKPALVSRRQGRGRVSYLGAWGDGGTMDAVVEWGLKMADVHAPALAPPAGVSCHELEGDDGVAWILNNCTDTTQAIEVPYPTLDVLTDRVWNGTMTLEPRGIAVLVKS
jgi:beta-galactosidase